VVLLVGVVGVLAVGTGFANDENANDENAAAAKCSEATLHGTYLFAYDGVDVKGKDQGPFAAAGYDVFDGNGKIDSVFSINGNGQVTRKGHLSGTYTVKADCTGTLFEEFDLFIAPDGSMFTLVQIKPPEQVASGFELRGTAKQVGD